MKSQMLLMISMSLAVSGCSGGMRKAPNETSAQELYRKEYEEDTRDGKPLRITITETERNDLTSLLVVELSSGASVPASMAIARASYEIARERGKPYFINLKEWDDGPNKRRYVIGFSDRREPNPPSHFGVEGSGKGRAEDYLSVSDFDSLFKSAE